MLLLFIFSSQTGKARKLILQRNRDRQDLDRRLEILTREDEEIILLRRKVGKVYG